MTLIVLVLAVLTALQLIRIFELSSKARKRAEYEIWTKTTTTKVG